MGTQGEEAEYLVEPAGTGQTEEIWPRMLAGRGPSFVNPTQPDAAMNSSASVRRVSGDGGSGGCRVEKRKPAMSSRGSLVG